MSKTPSQRLIDRIRKECVPHLPDDGVELVRSYSGKMAKSEWCWSWSLHHNQSVWVKDYGSIFTVKELLKCKSPLEADPETGTGTFHIGPSNPSEL